MKGQLCWHFALLLQLIPFPYLVFCQPVPEVTARVYPDNTEVQREGDSVSFLCYVSGFDASVHVVALVKVGSPSNIIVNSRYLHAEDNRFNVSFDEESEKATLNLTMSPVTLSDNGTYRCTLNENKLSSTVSQAIGNAELYIFVYPIEAFPVCNPVDEETVTVGSDLICKTSVEATPAIVEGNDEWKYFIGQNESGAVLTKNVASSDNGKTYVCLAVITASQMNLSCNIGPLIVVTGHHQSTPNVPNLIPTANTKTNPTPIVSGLSAAAISGIVIGVIALLLTIAVHTFCCRCNPRRWFDAKSYLLNRGSSFGTSHSQNDNDRRQSDVEMNSSHPERDDVPPPYTPVLTEQSEVSFPDIGERSRSLLKGESNVYSGSRIQTHKPNINIDLHLDLNIAVSDTNDQREGQVNKLPSEEESGVRITNDAPGDKSNCPRDTNERNQSWKGGVASVPAEAPTKPPPAPQIYAQVNKLPGNDAAEYGDTSPIPADTAAKPTAEKKPKNIKKFVKTVADEDEAIAPQTIIYADLDMTRVETGTGSTDIKTSEDPPTIYAEIKHYASADPESTAVDTN